MVGNNAMEIFLLLDKSNCRECGEKTCLAFAGAVFRGMRRIDECPRLNAATVTEFTTNADDELSRQNDLDNYIAKMRKELVHLDFRETALRTGGQVTGDILQITMLGKLFGIRKDGSFTTDLHLIPWVVIPLLEYVLNSKMKPVAGAWISFREMPGGKEKYALFKKRGEDVLLELADRYTDFFDDVIHMFDGKAVEKQFEADVSVVLAPLPLAPMMICYWKPGEGMASSLNIFFDRSAGDNIGVDSAFFFGTGLAHMLGKLATHHGF